MSKNMMHSNRQNDMPENNSKMMNEKQNTASQQFTGVSSEENDQYATVQPSGDQPNLPSSLFFSQQIADQRIYYLFTNNDMSLPYFMHNSEFFVTGHHIGIDTVGPSLRKCKIYN